MGGNPVTQQQPAESFTLPGPDGSSLEALLYRPSQGQPPWPTILVASGSGYPKEGAMFESLGRQAASAGWLVVTFDWRYTISGGRASSTRKKELADLEAALAYLVSRDDVSQNRIIIAGKSMGSTLAYKVFGEHPELFGVALLTPVFRSTEGAERNYHGLSAQLRPVFIVAGESDPLNNLDIMNDHISGHRSSLVVSLVQGDHGLNITRGKAPEQQAINRAHIDTCMSHLVEWLKELP